MSFEWSIYNTPKTVCVCFTLFDRKRKHQRPYLPEQPAKVKSRKKSRYWKKRWNQSRSVRAYLTWLRNYNEKWRTRDVISRLPRPMKLILDSNIKLSSLFRLLIRQHPSLRVTRFFDPYKCIWTFIFSYFDLREFLRVHFRSFCVRIHR